MKRHGKTQATMDRFVVRSPKVSPASSPTKPKGVLQQATLESLKGVVVLEEMERARAVLLRTDVSTELKVDTLQHLLRKNPAKEVLIKTKLGKTVHKLCRAKEGEVAAAAQEVYSAWKKHILSKTNRPYIEVKCDLKTQRLRNSARQMLHEALQRDIEEGGGEKDLKSNRGQVEVEDSKSSTDGDRVLQRKETKQNICNPEQKREKRKGEGSSKENTTHKRLKEDNDTERYKCKTKPKEEEGENEGARNHKKYREESGDSQKGLLEVLAEQLEQKLYLNCQRRVHNSYRRTVRALVFTLRHQREVRKAVVLATLSMEDFIKQHMKS